jgi:hypothetical protein
MFQTIALSSRVLAQGEMVQVLGNGEVVIRDGRTYYRGPPIGRTRGAVVTELPSAAPARPVAGDRVKEG